MFDLLSLKRRELSNQQDAINRAELQIAKYERQILELRSEIERRQEACEKTAEDIARLQDK